MTVPSLSSVCWPRLQLEGRKYCEHDFQMLFAPCCRTCGKGRTGLGAAWGAGGQRALPLRAPAAGSRGRRPPGSGRGLRRGRARGEQEPLSSRRVHHRPRHQGHEQQLAPRVLPLRAVRRGAGRPGLREERRQVRRTPRRRPRPGPGAAGCGWGCRVALSPRGRQESPVQSTGEDGAWREGGTVSRGPPRLGALPGSSLTAYRRPKRVLESSSRMRSFESRSCLPGHPQC